MKRVTIQDVAEALNLSRNTVSRALNDSKSVSNDTKARIVEKAIEMGYSKIDLKLKDVIEAEFINKRKNIAVFASGELSEFWHRIINGVSAELNKNNCNLLFNIINVDDQRDLIIPANVHNNHVDGIIILNIFTDDYIKKLNKLEIPMVFLDYSIDLLKEEMYGDIVLVEGEHSVYKITKNIIQKGKKKIGFIGDVSYCKTIYDRWVGYKRALVDSNIEVDEKICIIDSTANHYYWGNELTDELSKLEYIPDAFVCANDAIALIVNKYFENLGDKNNAIEVTGFDRTADNGSFEVTLTTAEVDNLQVGKRLVEELLWRIDNIDRELEIATIRTTVKFKE
ncbi:LacI family DNA-binding transcriptional regulator [Clostridium cellulovorans]|uniref:Transcriptional regulator, LacI family n=1 Tax=Clostridium cellulovorans (strain ATCC 35296 / DSM 3052 / OCM 3 / 743B) TaxID=573061 RepID=D9SUD7_CLOC7|nr:LacI family DNA-binding transcriptional regulator [Clostridium cellulovorans]ADL52892.1 transcriptional regulator, LacI family [Clostridium cellulovorans 743B]